jgi:Domain of unknown function (DUF4347)
MNTLTQLNKKNPSVVSFSDRLSSIVILDPTIPECDRLLTGIKPNTKTYILKSQPDAIEQITKILAKHTEIAALHIITHGSPGTLYLGTTELNNSNIENYSQQFQQWRKALTNNASIILYGCEIAAGNTGKEFLTQLNQLTGANIAANSQPTGNSELGGTWDIPQLIPPSSQRPELALTETTLKTYSTAATSPSCLTPQPPETLLPLSTPLSLSVLRVASIPSASGTSTATANQTYLWRAGSTTLHPSCSTLPRK